MSNPGNPTQPEPGFPPPSPAFPPEPRLDPLPEPVGVPAFEPEDVPPMNEPLGIPGGMPPEIVPSGT
ncbi:hypothetical protein CTI14_05835 [Methylobacterium radiotolerans]|uniref:SET domain containing 1B n=1 Tax=Methylobacterium radiotolerans (strain ATCC 27329 / DSM 1819 / JCM 2831 / NBRC 15690 / NCIMB 10815 / 0-1) TaxID=426355 RepID=B1M165_METRJ|nr:hypothetical protein [Methylobacterium radiotolerans]ACB24615.1 SET domain containing 1B [Methylobacterium radiotolerans JCM 2831]KIU33374.1 SET domain-containing protein [Methylobacterium radiotolerans]ONF50203.1 SET domain-containing protein [Methylobacterium radiotolerans]PJI55325.1 hypothetical protein CTI14_05835 [Methylobacterium radiotolerans]GEN00861.1 hypothetical protein MRA01_54000 [Methylobacterium radiotolerans]